MKAPHAVERIAELAREKLVRWTPEQVEQGRQIVFSKDAIIHIPDKETLFGDIWRVLKPGGWFTASDWLRKDEAPPSDEMCRYIEAEGLSFAMASPNLSFFATSPSSLRSPWPRSWRHGRGP